MLILMKWFYPIANKRETRIADFVEYDVTNQIYGKHKEKFPLVWIDPPWSAKLLKFFILRAFQALSENGFLVVSLPPVLTRPSAKNELLSINRLLARLGLINRAKFMQATAYELPLFEKKAYSTAGVEIKYPWRKGDLLILQKQEHPTNNIDCFIQNLSISQNIWKQVHHNKNRIFLKHSNKKESKDIEIKLINGMNNSILNTVSSRNNLWKHADVITTDNNIYKCNNIDQLYSYLVKSPQNIREKFLTT